MGGESVGKYHGQRPVYQRHEDAGPGPGRGDGEPREDLSSNTGRTTSGKMVGTVVAVKTTLKIKWPILTPAQVATIEGAVSDPDNPFVPVKYTDATGSTVTKTMYFGTPSYTVYSWANGRQYIKGACVDGIEQ